ncbi:hypothetical protein [Alkalihalobacillus sp. BA299]|uniref:hypothetical protein n=1 Tax=Alkalihalobacillus sp. BA299 TaxID=2815938 RepID=UPI001AD9F679|nr:hypothetical protein [Alkalihalobacillus sp. BA299]
MSQNGCDNWFKCWGCGHFLIRKEEIDDAIKTLALQIVNMREMINTSKNFTNENPIAAGQIKTISLIVKRLSELSLSQDEIDEKVMNFFINNSIIEK